MKPLCRRFGRTGTQVDGDIVVGSYKHIRNLSSYLHGEPQTLGRSAAAFQCGAVFRNRDEAHLKDIPKRSQ